MEEKIFDSATEKTREDICPHCKMAPIKDEMSKPKSTRTNIRSLQLTEKQWEVLQQILRDTYMVNCPYVSCLNNYCLSVFLLA